MNVVNINKEGDALLVEKEIYLLLMDNPEKGIEKIMDQYIGYVYTIVYGKLSSVCNKQDIEECVSDVFYEIYKTRSNIDLKKGSLKAYLAVVSKRKAIDVFRKFRKKSGKVQIDEYNHDWIASNMDVEKAVTDKEANNLLIQEIKKLGQPDCQIMIRKYYYGQSSKVISKALGMKENTVNKRVSRVLVKLKEVLGGEL